MPVFRLQLLDGVVERLDDVALPDAEQARLHAIRRAGEVLQAQPERATAQDLRVEVSTEEGLLLCSVIVLCVSSAAAQLDRI